MTPFTFVHVLLSLIAIVAGIAVAVGLLTQRRLERWTLVFLVTTAATCATGFLFPFVRFLPSHAVGILTSLIVIVAIYARYSRHMRGVWRAVYVVAAIAAFFFNSFVLVAQAFLKIPSLHELAPTQAEPPFAIAQGLLFAVFLFAGVLAVRRFRPAARE
ncbi:MAG: hypothetical protein ABI411_12685 [Tahibacter sp.]